MFRNLRELPGVWKELPKKFQVLMNYFLCWTSLKFGSRSTRCTPGNPFIRPFIGVLTAFLTRSGLPCITIGFSWHFYRKDRARACLRLV